jgi:hypothetical protein
MKTGKPLSGADCGASAPITSARKTTDNASTIVERTSISPIISSCSCGSGSSSFCAPSSPNCFRARLRPIQRFPALIVSARMIPKFTIV